MVHKLLCIGFLVIIAYAVQGQDTQQFLDNLKKLDALIQKYESRNQIQPSQPVPRKHHHHRASPSLYNVQNLNLVLKRNKHQHAAQNALRTLEKSVALETEDRMCAQNKRCGGGIGRCGCNGARCGSNGARCGCGGGRCGNNREHNSLEQLLDNMEEQLGSSKHKERSHHHQKERDDDHHDDHRGDHHHDHRGDHHDDRQNPLQKMSLGDNVDVVVLDLPSLKKLLRDPAGLVKPNKKQRSILPRTKQQLSRLLAQHFAKIHHSNTRRHLENPGRRKGVSYKVSGQALAQAN